MADFIVVVILAVIVGAAVRGIVKAKKNGAKCMGCSSGCHCTAGKERKTSCECDKKQDKR